MKQLMGLSLFVLILSACQSDGVLEKLKPLDLMQYQVPITIMAPDSAKVRVVDLLVAKDITVKGADRFDLQIFASDATTTDIPRVTNGLKAEVEAEPLFVKFHKEEENSFIYESKIDSTQTSYGFKLVRIQGDREYIFQNAFVGIFNLPEIELMYNAVKEKKK